ncbi:MAG: hypothetical protein UU81_C0025G0011 [Microgenomates group bacterium GW2011_GWC1_41_8]|uniref:DUF1573 domain-containing protein n=3 Tax=Candidatus Roizmaniibacteriota TaxID=1752723 RepID=A0A0G0XC06_9BACT|nr:MAG: hypothetical protein UU14_C0019G0021 [Candidatus Roizmanbacteria bacterium GW2011_GWB1_40_7]KKR94093.1 MAG: hypothetical protein UU41_C0013G0015 [Candidatus Roizmanbacteria bacterium GW2011_GWA1_41_13]KKS22415.1 MAG: hypothetical protein UU78_C0017G0019 [Candidatus Roizmanbacteria bacterium GW2011_GWC2_41_7]KKS23584.1 MAG: hypothetical protein UU81_C0025G0011 [Microgenomates group bacterium GW2011_GWC1_41_8]OGK50755.1 MAG: hypothetical protein A3A55_03870 [Candidatus Roizmanbacteria bac
MQEKKIIISIAFISAIILFGGAVIASKYSPGADVVSDEKVDVLVEKTSYDWGEIDINNGTVSQTFPIKNNGSSSLTLQNIATSCMCTTAKLTYNGQTSPDFGMHEKSNYSLSVLPGESADLTVTFDPAFHGPSGVGPITRQVIVETNDPDNQQLEFSLTAQVL